MRKYGTKTTPVFSPADGEASSSLLPSSVSLLSGGTVQPENTYSHILKEAGQARESQKRISININPSYHQRSSPKPVSTDLTIKAGSVLTNPIGKDGMRSWSMWNIYSIGHFIVTPSLEGRSTKGKDAPSPHEVRLAPLDTNPAFHSLGDKLL